MTRDNNTTRRGINATVSFMVIRKTKMNARQRSWFEFVRGGRGCVGKANATKNAKRKIVRMREKK